MANAEHLKILKQGATEWNVWRKQHEIKQPDLLGADLHGADLTNAILSNAILPRATLRGAHLSGAHLTEADLIEADLSGADLSGAHLNGATLNYANLNGADLREANLVGTTFSGATLSETVCYQAILASTIFARVNLSSVKGLEACVHRGPSSLDSHTLLDSKNLPEVFLRGCGLTDWEIETTKLHNPSLDGSKLNDLLYRIHELRIGKVILSGSLFISYSHQDKLFVNELEQRFNEKGIRYWRDIHDATAGPLEPQVDRAIRHNPIVLLILSVESTKSDWVEHEVQKARKLEKETGRHVLCPIALDETWKTSAWPERLREQIEKYNILDFSDWKTEDSLTREMGKLLDGLDTYYRPPTSSKP